MKRIALLSLLVGVALTSTSSFAEISYFGCEGVKLDGKSYNVSVFIHTSAPQVTLTEVNGSFTGSAHTTWNIRKVSLSPSGFSIEATPSSSFGRSFRASSLLTLTGKSAAVANNGYVPKAGEFAYVGDLQKTSVGMAQSAPLYCGFDSNPQKNPWR